MTGLAELKNLVKLDQTTKHITIASATPQDLSLSSTKCWLRTLGPTRVHAFHLPDTDKETEPHISCGILITVPFFQANNGMQILVY